MKGESGELEVPKMQSWRVWGTWLMVNYSNYTYERIKLKIFPSILLKPLKKKELRSNI